MRSDVPTSNHRSREIGNFRGLITNISDPRSLSPSMQSIAQDCMFDGAGNVRPRDGYARFWPEPIPQRLQLADFQPAEAWNSLAAEAWVVPTGASLDSGAPYAGPQCLKCGTGSAVFSGTAYRADLNVSVDAIRNTANGYPLGVYARLKAVGAAPNGMNLVSSVVLTLTTSVGVKTFTLSLSTLWALTPGAWADIFIGSKDFTAGETITKLEVTVSTTSAAGVYGVLYMDDIRLQAVPAGISSSPEGLLGIAALAADVNGVVTGCADKTVTPRNYRYSYQGSRGGDIFDEAHAAFLAAGKFRPSSGQVAFGSYMLADLAYNAAGQLMVLTDSIWSTDPVTGQAVRNPQSFVAYVDSDRQMYTFKSIADLQVLKGTFPATCLACSPDGHVFIGMLNNAVFTADGVNVGQSSYNSNCPGAAFDSSNRLFCVDRESSAVRRYDPVAGYYELNTPTAGFWLSEGAAPVHCVCDNSGYLYIVESGLHRVTKYRTSDGAYQSAFGSEGYGEGEFVNPTRIALSAAGTLLVADAARGDVQEFSTAGVFLRRFAPPVGYYEDSFCTGIHEFKKLGAPQSRLLAMFGETLWSDLNNSKSPVKVKSGFTRNVPARFASFENRVLVCNGQDDNLVYSGNVCRKAGYPAPSFTSTPTLTPATTGGSMAAGVYHYWMTYVYGEGTTMHGESSATYIGSATIASGIAGKVTLTGLPVGSLGSGVVMRRIYRSQVDADAEATAKFDVELEDNVTTTATSDQNDTTLVVQDSAPRDNGIPPKARYAVFFQRGMIYMNGLAVYNSRPGTNLNETPETVPANALNILPAYGEITGAMQLGANLYIFQEGCIHAGEWVGSDFTVRPVLSAKQGGHGAIDQSHITVWKGHSLLFRDPQGKLWQMLENEEISAVTETVENLFADSNPHRPSNQFYSYTKTSALEWEAPTTRAGVGKLGANLMLLEDGGLTYKYPREATVDIASMVPSVDSRTYFDNTPNIPGYPDSSYSALHGNSSYEMLIEAKQPVRITGVTINAALTPYQFGTHNGTTIPSWGKVEIVKIGEATSVTLGQSAGNLLAVLGVAVGSALLEIESASDIRKSSTFDPSQSLASQVTSLNTAPASAGVIKVNGVDFAWSATSSLNTIMAAISADTTAKVNVTFDAATGVVAFKTHEATAGEVLWTSAEQQADMPGHWPQQVYFIFDGASVYVPAGDRVIVRFKRRDADDTAYWGSTRTRVYPTVLTGSALSSVGSALFGSIHYSPVLRTELVSTVIDSDAYCPAGESLVRWGTPVVKSPYLRGGAALSVYLETSSVSTRGSDLGSTGLASSKVCALTRQNDTGWKAFPEPNYGLAASYLYPVRDYRNGEDDVEILPEMSPRRRYAWVRVVLDPTAVVPTPDRAAHSRVSTNIRDVFPNIDTVTVAFASQPTTAIDTAFDPNAYTEDQYVTEPVFFGSMGELGAFHADWTQGQQTALFYIRMAETLPGLSGAPWLALTIGSALAKALIPANAGYFQLMVQFQDRQESAVGYDAEAGYAYVPTYVRSLSLSWGDGSNAIASPTQGFMLEDNGQVICSWPSSNSSVVNRTMYIDQHQAGDGSLSWRFSMWTNKHFTAMYRSAEHFLAAPQHGGLIYECYQSVIGDDEHGWPGAVYGRPAVVAGVPCQFGTPSLKTIQDLYVGVDLSVYAKGYRAQDLNFYPVAAAPAGQEIPAFKWSVSTTPAGNGIVVSANPTMSLTDKTASQVFEQRLSHGGTGANSSTDVMKPYCTEYWFDVGAQEYAVVIAVQLTPFKDTDGRSIFPSLSGLGVGFWVDNIRGV